MLTYEQVLQQAITLHRAGQLQEAERLYRAILQALPHHPNANHNLGLLALITNAPTVALPLFKRALDADPSIEQFWLSYVQALIGAGQLTQAEQLLGAAPCNTGSPSTVDSPLFYTLLASPMKWTNWPVCLSRAAGMKRLLR
ncbi:tetratricopeptide repeat protein [Pseudomonas sp. UMAB-08]|uniref:tetratricopeptide repeat protein n=1 Tax=Pseudomonas sp. UMAB-08 TaxID=1365375 RepID=UPI001C5A1FA7|nr:tetratricopeptide repeat protein [Pseudomonas sp. UMAB-08]